jgi:hypothetical protein
LQKLVVVDQLPAKTVLFGPEVILELKAMRADWSVKLVVEDWASWNMHHCTDRKPKSRRMVGHSIGIIMTVFQEKVFMKKEKKAWRYITVGGFKRLL